MYESDEDFTSFLRRTFSEAYLFDDSHSAWKQMQEEQDGWVFVSQFEAFPEIVEACEDLNELVQVAKRLEDFEVNPENTAIRRKTPLDESKNPALRTLFVKPIHVNATEEEISSFFSSYGTVERVEKSFFLDYDLRSNQLKRLYKSSAFLQFSSVEEAQQCYETKPQLGQLNNFGDYFLPRLQYEFKKDYEELLADKKEANELRRQRETLIQTLSPDEHEREVSIKKFVQDNSILKLLNPPTGVTWRAIKTVLSELVKGKCHITYVREDTEGHVVYLYMKTAKAASILLDAYRSARDSTRLRTRRVAPMMELCTGDEELEAQERFLKEENERIQKKITRNEKRARRIRQVPPIRSTKAVFDSTSLVASIS